MTRDDLQILSNIRLREAQALFTAGEYSGAYYLAGYAVECALKACIASKTVQFEFPDKKRAQDSFTHNFPELVKVANLQSELAAEAKKSEFDQRWRTTIEWSEASRYRTFNRADAEDLLNAVADNTSGVLGWVHKYW